MQLCWSTVESRPAIAQIELMLADLLEVYKNTKQAPQSSSSIVDDFDKRWETFKPNTIVRTDDHVVEINSEANADADSAVERYLNNKELSPSMNNLLEDTVGVGNQCEEISKPKERLKVDFKLGPSHKLARSVEVLNTFENDSLTDSMQFAQRTSSESETEDENWKRKIERGAYSEKVRQKSRSVTDLMVLTHIDCSESDSETPLPSLDYRINYRNVRYAPKTKQNLENVSLMFGSEGNLLSVHDTFQEELKKLQEERRDSLLFVPEHNSQNDLADSVTNDKSDEASGPSFLTSLPSKKILEELNSPVEIKPVNQVFNVFNVTVDHKFTPHFAESPKRQSPARGFSPKKYFQVPTLVDLIQNNMDLLDYIIARYDPDPVESELEVEFYRNFEESAESIVDEVVKVTQNYKESLENMEKKIAKEKENLEISLENNSGYSIIKQTANIEVIKEIKDLAESSENSNGTVVKETQNIEVSSGNITANNTIQEAKNYEQLSENAEQDVIKEVRKVEASSENIRGRSPVMSKEKVEEETENSIESPENFEKFPASLRQKKLEQTENCEKLLENVGKNIILTQTFEVPPKNLEQFTENFKENRIENKETKTLAIFHENTEYIGSETQNSEESLENIKEKVANETQNFEETSPENVEDRIIKDTSKLIDNIETIRSFLENERHHSTATENKQFKIEFDLNESIHPNYLTHSLIFTSSPYARKSLPETHENDLTSLNLCQEEEIPPQEEKENLTYSLETWDNFLGKTLEEQSQEDHFSSFNSEPQSMLFLDAWNGYENNEGDVFSGEGNEQENVSVDEPMDKTFDVLNSTFVIDDSSEKNKRNCGVEIIEISNEEEEEEEKEMVKNGM